MLTGEESKLQSLDSRSNDPPRENRSSFGSSTRGYDRGGRRDDRDRDRDREYDRGYDSRYPRRDRGNVFGFYSDHLLVLGDTFGSKKSPETCNHVADIIMTT